MCRSWSLSFVLFDEEVYVYFSMTENQMLSLLRQYGSVDKSLAGPIVQIIFVLRINIPPDADHPISFSFKNIISPEVII